MKTFLTGLLSAALGFSFSRLLPATVTTGPEAGRRAGTAETKTASVSFKPKPLPGKPAPTDSPEIPDWQAAAKAWSEEDPAGFCDWLVRRGVPPGWPVLEILFSAWTSSDPDAALRAAVNLPADFDRGAALSYALYNVLEKPGGLSVMLKWIPAAEGQVDSMALPTNGAWLTEAPPEQIAGLLMNFTGKLGFYRQAILRQLSAKWAETDREAALDWARTLGPEARKAAFSGILDPWSKTDPVGVLKFLATKATTAERALAEKPLTELAQTQPEDALRWWEANLGTGKDTLLKWIFAPWVENDGEAAKAYAFGVEDPVLRKACLISWGRSSPPSEVLSTVKNLPSGPDKTTLTLPLIAAFRDREATAYVKEAVMSDSPDLTPENVARFTRIQANRNPAATFDWVAGIPEKYQARSLAGVMAAWADATAASRAVEQLPDGAFKDRARQALKTSLADPDRGK
jgi:hypothetical protein